MNAHPRERNRAHRAVEITRSIRVNG